MEHLHYSIILLVSHQWRLCPIAIWPVAEPISNWEPCPNGPNCPNSNKARAMTHRSFLLFCCSHRLLHFHWLLNRFQINLDGDH